MRFTAFYNLGMDKDRLNNKLIKRLDYLNRLIGAIEPKLPTLPDGKLRIQKYANTTSYYYVKKGETNNGTLIGADNTRLIHGLAQKAYYQKVLRAAKSEQKLISQFTKRFPDPSVEQVYESMPVNRRALITPVALTDEEYLNQWLNKTYTPKFISNDIPYYMTMNGERVRSKSEQIIADRLKANNIPYKYECPLQLHNGKVHPDFTILRMSDREEIYYEHLGRMDDPGYAETNVQKINDYELSGYHLGEKLFTTMETRQCPLDTRVLDEMIRKSFR